VVAAAGCAGSAPDPGGDKTIVVAPERQGVIEFDLLMATLVKGTYYYHGVTARFASEVVKGAYEITLELRGMTLTATIDPSGVFDLDGFKTETGAGTAMTEVDSTVIHTLEVALADIYRERAGTLPALAMLNRAITVWGQYSSTLPLQRTFYSRQERIALHDLCGQVNKPGQGGPFNFKWTWGSHDCLTVKSFASDCAFISGGCAYADDGSTIDRGFMSMHPEGSCDDNTYFGQKPGNFSCYEPDHDSNTEYAYGACLGRCGGSCGGGTVFSQACLDHDVCVRTGHFIASPECDDELLDATLDAIVVDDCPGANFNVDFNWAGTGNEGACPDSWNNMKDGCDVGCQFVDADCFR
jgi:hypothetical protein